MHLKAHCCTSPLPALPTNDRILWVWVGSGLVPQRNNLRIRRARPSQGGTETSVAVHGRVQVGAAEGLREAVLSDIRLTIASDWMFAREIESGGIAVLSPLNSRYTRIALTQGLRRIIEADGGYGLALKGISAADFARGMAAGLTLGCRTAKCWAASNS